MEDTESKGTPMGKVWLIVLGSVLFVVGAALLWHYIEIRALAVSDMAEEQKTADNIEKLSHYRDQLLASSSPTAHK